MRIGEDDIEGLEKDGARVRGAGGAELKPAPKSAPTMEWTLRRLVEVLNRLPQQIAELAKAEPQQAPAAPPPTKQDDAPRKWRFTHKRDDEGRITETVAEAED